MKGRSRRAGPLSVALLVALMMAVAGFTSSAGAALVGFTGEDYYCDYNLTGARSNCYAPYAHSYGFNSATYKGSESIAVCAGLPDPFTGGQKVACGTNLARVCLSGTYPNCTDRDGFATRVNVYNGSNYAHTVVGHGLY